MRPLVIFAAIVLSGAVMNSCGGDDSASTSATTSPSVTSATATPTASSEARVSAPTAEELTAVAEAMFPLDQSGQYGVEYPSCDFPSRAAPSTYDPCPVTARLKTRLLEVDAGSELLASSICRCQNFSNTRDIVASPDGSGGTAVVTIFGQALKLELVIVRENDKLLVDDTRCAGYPQTSLYSEISSWACPSSAAADAALAAAVQVVKGVAGNPDCPASGGQWCVKPDSSYELSVPHGLAVFGIGNADTGEGAHLIMGETSDGRWDYWTTTQQDLEPLTLPGDMLVCSGGAGLNVRSSPATDAAVVQTLADGTVVKGVFFRLTEPGTFPGALGDGWYQISAPAAGWVYSRYVFNPQNATNCTGLPLPTAAP